MNKKGSALDVLYIIVFLFVFAIGLIIADKVLYEIDEGTNTTLGSSNVSNFSFAQGRTSIRLFDFAYIFVVIGLFITTIIFAFLIKTHPVFFVASLMLFIVTVIIGVVLSNVYEEFTASPDLVDTANRFPVMNYVMDNLPTIVTIMGGLVLIVLYAKSGSPLA